MMALLFGLAAANLLQHIRLAAWRRAVTRPCRFLLCRIDAGVGVADRRESRAALTLSCPPCASRAGDAGGVEKGQGPERAGRLPSPTPGGSATQRRPPGHCSLRRASPDRQWTTVRRDNTVTSPLTPIVRANIRMG